MIIIKMKNVKKRESRISVIRSSSDTCNDVLLRRYRICRKKINDLPDGT